MPPKKLSISRIRAESRKRSDDPDLNRSSSSSSRASKRYRSAAGATSSSSARSHKAKRPPQPKISARILRIYEDDIEECEIQNRFAPDLRTERQNVSYRPLTLSQQARRDGADFQLPSLASACCSVVASCFSSLLPSREHFDAAAAAASGGSRASSGSSRPIKNAHTLQKRPSTRKKSKPRAFGAPPDSEDDQADYVPSDEETVASGTAARSTRSRAAASTSKAASGSGSNQLLAGWTTSELHYLTRKTSEQLKLLSPNASFLLYKALVEQAPQYLTKTVISSYFLPPILDKSALTVSSATTAAKTHIWLPASLPLLAHDRSAASFLVGHMTSAITAAREHRPSTLSQGFAENLPLAALPPRITLAQPMSFALRLLQLHGLTRLQDATLARFFEAAAPSSSQQPESILRLDIISLRGCIAIADRSVTAMCRATGSTLRYLNLDYTDISADSVATIMTHAPELRTLKLGYNENLSDKTLQVALEAPKTGNVLPFSTLANLRLRRCEQVGEAGIAMFLRYAYSTLEVLDVSDTNVSRLRPDIKFLGLAFSPTGNNTTLPLRKINLQGANFDCATLANLIDRSPNFETLMVDQKWHTHAPDDATQLLQKLVAKEDEGGWRNRKWKRLCVRTIEPCSDFQRLLPDLFSIFPVGSTLLPSDLVEEIC